VIFLRSLSAPRVPWQTMHLSEPLPIAVQIGGAFNNVAIVGFRDIYGLAARGGAE